ncbi:TetR/AcrR family transcriptional regulator [[Mycobacterium] wendilense]|uniref:TetR/AcrR family transcriptional regulator n=1 Tax=[Mycobacterium] wendilense TaxID=3064284 RepID=A0ABN9NXC6_9MYCO|nr:TetR/AcrR family transcriptional regulator [Mycolicibacterium sp. MU0050]CAJ1581924.1 TetR/AcrR family transcriptional regulator [Mycolicibacterium sp. MU0050]
MTADPQTPQLADRRGPYRGETRRAEILAGLADLLQQRRFDEISVADISAAAGVKRNTFYFYFANKSVAVAALLSDLFAEMIAGAEPFITHVGEPRENVQGGIDNVVASWQRNTNLYMAILDARHSDPAVQQFWDDWLAQFVGPIAEAITVEREAGRARPGPDATTLTVTLIGTNVSLLDRIGRSGFTPELAAAAREALFHIWYHAIYG